MPYTPIDIAPGVVTDVTEFTAKGRWRFSNRIRFRDGLPEPIGGWQKRHAAAQPGVARAAHAWGQLDGTKTLALGTSKKLLVEENDTITNITPIRDSGTLGTNPFATTNGSATITVTHSAHGLAAGTTASFSGATTFNGVTITGEYDVVSVVDGDTYTIVDDETANATGSGGGGSVAYEYEINIGQANSTGGFGWGASTWGASTWGTARPSSSVILDLRLWSLLNWGEDLLASPRGSQLYHWDASVGPGTRAQLIGASPTALYFIVSPDDAHVVALGAAGEPLKVQWCNQGDFNNWTISSTTTAGTNTLRHGSTILGGRLTKQEILIWTDKALFSMRYIGGQFTFQFRTIGFRGVIVGPLASVEHNDVVYWLGDGNFWVYDGRMRHFPCTVLREVFDDFDFTQKDKVVAATNQEFHEIWWFYPSASGGGENDRYVKYNFRENLWDYGVIARTAWIDRDIFDNPIAADPDGFIFDHEQGYEDDGAALGEFIETGDYDVADSERLMLVRRLIPDFVLNSGSVDITLKGRKYPGTTQISKGPFTITPAMSKIHPRLRARRAALRIAGSTQGTFWRLGRLMADVIPIGRR